jgi:hypothetical protein
MGLPGVLLAFVLVTTLRDPLRGRFQSTSEKFDTDITWYQAIGQVHRVDHVHRRRTSAENSI